MKLIPAALLPLAVAACAPPSDLPAQDTLGLAAETATSPRGTAVLVPLFPDFEARPVAQPDDWVELSGARGPEGARK